MSELRVLVVADDPLARAGLAALLTGRCDVVGQVSGETELPLDVYRPDVVLWDLGWDVDALPEHLADWGDANPPVVALLPEDHQTASVWAAGVRGLLLRSADSDHLLAALEGAAHGLAVFQPELVKALRETNPISLSQELTARELEVLHLLTEGLPNKAIARRLEISEHTVKFHLNAILSKLNAQSRTEAVVQAIRLGLITI
ncbi:MAG TPA: response regulator transcription factor [Aggregatilineaceae bacterium]|nr:response regulator transcription factor [Aggregatilineaceae bacterium]